MTARKRKWVVAVEIEDKGGVKREYFKRTDYFRAFN